MQRKDLKILLLQIRDDANVRKEELESFAKYSELDVAQIDVLNVFDFLISFNVVFKFILLFDLANQEKLH